MLVTKCKITTFNDIVYPDLVLYRYLTSKTTQENQLLLFTKQFPPFTVHRRVKTFIYCNYCTAKGCFKNVVPFTLQSPEKGEGRIR